MGVAGRNIKGRAKLLSTHAPTFMKIRENQQCWRRAWETPQIKPRSPKTMENYDIHENLLESLCNTMNALTKQSAWNPAKVDRGSSYHSFRRQCYWSGHEPQPTPPESSRSQRRRNIRPHGLGARRSQRRESQAAAIAAETF